MSKVDELIAKLCPNGVEFAELNALLDYTRPERYIVKSTNYENSYSIPVLTAGETFILGYTNETEGIYQANKLNPVIIFDDFTTSFHWVDFPFKIKSSAIKILTPKNIIFFRYAYYAMKTIRYTPSSHARQYISTYSRFKIPVPPLEIQHEIVRVLDAFTELEAELKAELKAELEARQKQYQYYRDTLLNFDNQDVARVCLEQIATFRYGFTAKAKDVGYYRFIRITDILGNGKLSHTGLKYLDDTDDCEDYFVSDGDILMARTGATFGKTVMVTGDAPAVYASYLIKIDFDKSTILPSYYWHFAQSSYYWKQANRLVSGGGQQQFNANVLKTVEIPIPPLEEQERIVAILDKFDALVNNLSEGLPAEIAARKKQYEYYRNQLLTFRELV